MLDIFIHMKDEEMKPDGISLLSASISEKDSKL